MHELLRHTGRALAAILIAGGIGQTAVAATISNSGNLSFDCVLGCGGTNIELVAFGTDGFKIQRSNSDPLAANQNVSLTIGVTIISGFISSWSAELIGATGNFSMGESINDSGGALLANLTVSPANPYAVRYFAPIGPGPALILEKDINFTAGSVQSVIQSVAVPEPMSMLLFGVGIAGLGIASRRGRRSA